MATPTRARNSRPLKRRRIIERPRLFALLDESTSRVRMLVAAAGYGKTTLAEQWVARDGRRAAWFRARRASTDVAALALGLARAAAEFVPGCDERLREHLRAVPDPGERVEVLAEILGDELTGWASTDWLVLDDYQQLVGAPDAERFVEELVAISAVQILIASRQRPAWVSGRTILYGDVLELGQTVLAMDAREAAELLEDRSAASTTGLVALANGWPAVLALASVSDAEILGDDEVPDSLYSFFADEVFDALGDDVRAGLATLAVGPILDRELAAELLGTDVAEAVCRSALDVGILEERGTFLELHPLARSFLEERSGQVVGDSVSAPAATCCAHYTFRRDWDAAFEVIIRRGPAAELETLFASALDDLLETAHLSTIDTWCDAAARAGLDRPLVSIARAEVALRRGRLVEAQAFAEVAAAGNDEASIFRALATAARAAHLASREEDALELYRQAEAVAQSEAQRRDARWGQFLCGVELELPETGRMLESLLAEVARSDPREVVRGATCELWYQTRVGPLDLTNAEGASQLVDSVGDPLIRSSFHNVFSHVLALSARYHEASEVIDALLDDITRHRLDFALPYAQISAGTASAGMREWSRAASHFGQARVAARKAHNAHAAQLCYAAQVRALAQEGKLRSALSIEVPPLHQAIPGVRAEVLVARALVLAAAGRVDEACALIADVRETTSAIEVVVLVAAVEVVVAIKRRERGVVERVSSLEQIAFDMGTLDLLVTAYRTCSELFAMLLRDSTGQDRLSALVQAVGDSDLAGAAGHPLMLTDDDLRARLTPREREVYALLREGLSNRQIAEILVISEGTAKLHTHHVYDKTGMRSRTAIAMQAALERANHATSATGAKPESDSTW
jgi:DNA-binding NarL/FixJ family response regulator